MSVWSARGWFGLSSESTHFQNRGLNLLGAPKLHKVITMNNLQLTYCLALSLPIIIAVVTLISRALERRVSITVVIHRLDGDTQQLTWLVPEGVDKDDPLELGNYVKGRLCHMYWTFECYDYRGTWLTSSEL